MIYRFDSFELDTDLFELRENGASVTLEPQVFCLGHCLHGAEPTGPSVAG